MLRVRTNSSVRCNSKHVRAVLESANAIAVTPSTNHNMLMAAHGPHGTDTTVPPHAIAHLITCAAGSGMHAANIVALACNGRNALTPPESSQLTVGCGKLPPHRSSSSLSFGSQDLDDTAADKHQRVMSPTTKAINGTPRPCDANIAKPSTNVGEPKAGEPMAEAGDTTNWQLEADSNAKKQLEIMKEHMTTASRTSARKDLQKKAKEKHKATPDAPKKTNKTDKQVNDTAKRTPMKRPASAVLVVSDSKTPTKLEEGVMHWKKS